LQTDRVHQHMLLSLTGKICQCISSENIFFARIFRL